MKILILAPHVDDAELGLGATIAKLGVENNHEIVVRTFSYVYDKQDLLGEFVDSMDVLNVTDRHWYNFPTRHFVERRQDILDAMIKLRDAENPDVVYTPCSADTHQDHKVIYEESVRAFKRCTILGYEIPRNAFKFVPQLFEKLFYTDVERKWEALKCYESQLGRLYFNKDFIFGLAHVRGVQANTVLAESFEVIQMIK